MSVFDLVPSEDNFYSMNDIEELKSKIELAGKVLQNFIVVPLGGGKYKVLSGHRRRLAVLALVEEGKPEFEFVPCTIEVDEQDAEVRAIREEIMLIAANSQREKTAWDKIEETRRTRALLEKIRKQEKLPGDMRKLVAQTLNTSPAQIGRFDAIIRNLCPEFTEELKADRINISTAYELSGLSAEEQAARGGGPPGESATSGGGARRAGRRVVRGLSDSATDRHSAAGRGPAGRSATSGGNAHRGPHRAAEQQEAIGHDEPPAPSSQPPTGAEQAAEKKAEPDKAVEVARAIWKLEELKRWCIRNGDGWKEYIQASTGKRTLCWF